ncbi:ATP-binding protein [Bdellovibrio sp. 22V]|uniref:ATP-binding protein n=1 Tax=Bdellovibrio sp. 22V TaxID=3044166 RepID=UPI002542761E|nr:ATP-binding protein [Bdellovibrio sp. 22V]WII73289.1 ATP-binding protein [Bdellovibrio sp. 22V]
MKSKTSNSTNNTAKNILGCFLILALVAALEFTQTTAWKIPPTTILILAVVLSGFFGRIFLTAFAVVCAWLYLIYGSLTPDNALYAPQNIGLRLLVWSLALPMIGVLIIILKQRTDKPLREQLAELARSEHALRESEERFRAIVSSAHDALIVIDSHSIIQEWNPQAEVMFGWKRSEALSRHLTSTIIPERFREAHNRGLSRFLNTGEGPVLNKRFEIMGLTKEGREIPVELTIYPFKQGDLYFFGSFLHDISEKKKIERIQTTHFDVTRIMTEVNTLEEVIPLALQSLCTGLDFAVAELWLVHKGLFECKGFWPPNEPKYAELHESSQQKVIPDDDLFCKKLLSSLEACWFSDIAKEPKYQRADLVRRAGLKTCVASPIYEGGKVFGVMMFYSQEQLSPDRQIIETLEDTGKKMGLFMRRRLAEEELAVLYRNLEKKVEQRTLDLALANDQLTKEIEEKKVLYEQAQTANRLKDEFLATISHELRTPLNVIIGYSEMLSNEDIPEDELPQYYETIYRNAKAQSQIVNDILDISRIVTGKFKLTVDDVDIPSVIKAATESLRHAAEAKKIRITTTIDPVAATVAGDFGRLQQVMWNLISNAIKFTPQYGHIEIETSVIESQVKITVSDSGIGIDPSFVPYVFERFRQEDATTTRRFGGLGLGLALCKNIVELHGGTIQAHSAGKGKGSVFSVILPVHAVRLQSNLPFDFTENRKPELILQGLRLLVVEDQPDALNLLAKVLSRAGAEVNTAMSASEALKKIVNIKPHVLISDIGMPEQDGYDLIRMVRQLPADHGGNTLAIALTAYAHDEDQGRALREGFNLHVAKPVDSSTLIKTVSELAKGNAPPQPEITM